MSELPAAVARYLKRERLSETDLLALHFNPDWQLLGHFGELDQFGLADLDAETFSSVFQGLWTGYSRAAGASLPMVTLPGGAEVDIHQVSHGVDVYFILIDRSAPMAEKREIQQREQDAKIRLAQGDRQQRLLRKELVRSHQAIEQLQTRFALLVSCVDWVSEDLRRNAELQWLGLRLRAASGDGQEVAEGLSFAALTRCWDNYASNRAMELKRSVRLSTVGDGKRFLDVDSASVKAAGRLAIGQALERGLEGSGITVEIRAEPTRITLQVIDSQLMPEQERRCLWDKALPDLRNPSRVSRLLYALGHELSAAGGRATYAEVDSHHGKLLVTIPHGSSMGIDSTQDLRHARLRGIRVWVAVEDARLPELALQLNAAGAEWSPLPADDSLVGLSIREAPQAIVLQATSGALLARALRAAGFRGLLIGLTGSEPQARQPLAPFDQVCGPVALAETLAHRLG